MAQTCEECGFNWETSLLEQIRLIGTFPERAGRVLRGADDTVYRRPAAGVWSPNEYVWHMVDLSHMFSEWLHMTRTEDHPTHIPLDPERLAELRAYAGKPLATGLWALAAACRLLVQEAVLADPDRLVLYRDWRDVTAAEVIGFAAHEAAHHLVDLERGVAASAMQEGATNGSAGNRV